jgi:hypothetical protein
MAELGSRRFIGALAGTVRIGSGAAQQTEASQDRERGGYTPKGQIHGILLLLLADREYQARPGKQSGNGLERLGEQILCLRSGTGARMESEA